MFCVPLGSCSTVFAHPLAARLRVVEVRVGVSGQAAADRFQGGALQIVVLEVIVCILGHDLVGGREGVGYGVVGSEIGKGLRLQQIFQPMLVSAALARQVIAAIAGVLADPSPAAVDLPGHRFQVARIAVQVAFLVPSVQRGARA